MCLVSETAQVELTSGQVRAHATGAGGVGADDHLLPLRKVVEVEELLIGGK